MDNLLELTERIESLPFRSRVANARIWKICWADEYRQWESSSRVMLSKNLTEFEKQGEMDKRAKNAAPNFTGSLDAAITLVPEGWGFRVEREGDGSRPCSAAVYKPSDGCNELVALCDYAATPALALCVAALRARAA